MKLESEATTLKLKHELGVVLNELCAVCFPAVNTVVVSGSILFTLDGLQVVVSSMRWKFNEFVISVLFACIVYCLL